MPTKAQLNAELETLRAEHSRAMDRLLVALEENAERRERSRSRKRRSRQDLAEADRGKAAAALRVVCKHDRDQVIDGMAAEIKDLHERAERQHREIVRMRRGDGEILPILRHRLGDYPALTETLEANWGRGQTVCDFLDHLDRQSMAQASQSFGAIRGFHRADYLNVSSL